MRFILFLFYTPCWYYADIILMINPKSYFDFCCWWWSNHRQCLMSHAQWNTPNLLKFTMQICILIQLWNNSIHHIFWKIKISNMHEIGIYIYIYIYIYTGSTVILPIYRTTKTNMIFVCLHWKRMVPFMQILKQKWTFFTNILSLCSPHGSLLIRKSPRM